MFHSHCPGFAHQRLDCYAVAQELAAGVVHLTRLFPRGFADLREQLNRSALATVRHVAEGANRLSPADKRPRFAVARGECAECDASLETVARLGLAPAGAVGSLRQLADRVGAMLTGLVRRETVRLAERGAQARPASFTIRRESRGRRARQSGAGRNL